MNRIIAFVIIGILMFSCTNRNDGKNKKEIYLSKMEEKNFQLKKNGFCDDVLGDTMYERSVAYFDSKNLTDKKAIIEFKFIDACCQEFLGDYSIVNDTLSFKYEKVNEEVCGCLCWYRYKLIINESKENYKGIKIEEK